MALNTTASGATWFGRQGGWGTVTVPGSVQTAKATGDFGVRYPSLGTYQATLDLSQNPAVVTFGAASNAQGGDLVGYVKDASSTSALSGVDVYASGKCAGTGCPSASQGHERSVSTGFYGFDAYGDLNGASDVQQMTVSAGADAFALLYQKSGYQSLTQYFHPTYGLTTINNLHVLAATAPIVYLCPTGAADSDGDGLCDAAEAVYGTNPNNADTDGDAISDLHEVLGAADLDLRFYGANPRHKDVYVYMNYYVAPFPGALTQVTQAFAAGAATNPDGTTGINFHIIDGGQIAAADQVQDIVGPLSGDWSQVDVIKNKYFPARWASYAHYLLIGNTYDGTGSSGISRGIPAHDFLVTLGAWSPAYGTQLEQAGTLMHELGHNLGLQHGGNEGQNYKPNYLSIMSYRYQVVGLYKDATDGVIDYSRLQLASVNESALAETSGMPPTGSTTTADTAHFGAKFCSGLVQGTVKGPLDFNGDGVYETGTESVDLDCDGTTSGVFNASWNDWLNITYTGNTGGGGAIGPGATPRPGFAAAAVVSTPQLVTPDKMERELDHP